MELDSWRLVSSIPRDWSNSGFPAAFLFERTQIVFWTFFHSWRNEEPYHLPPQRWGGRWYGSSFLQLWKNVQNTIWVRSNRKAAGNPLFDQSRGIELTNLQESSSIGLSSQALPKQSRAGSSEMLALTARPLTAGAPRQRRQRRVECACQAPAESWRRAALCRHHCWAWRCRRGQAAERAGRLAVSSSRHWPSWSAVVALHVHEAPSLRRFAEARLSSLAHAHAGTSHQRWPHSQLTPRSSRAVAT